MRQKLTFKKENFDNVTNSSIWKSWIFIFFVFAFHQLQMWSAVHFCYFCPFASKKSGLRRLAVWNAVRWTVNSRQLLSTPNSRLLQPCRNITWFDRVWERLAVKRMLQDIGWKGTVNVVFGGDEFPSNCPLDIDLLGLLDVMGVEVELLLVHSRRLAAPNKIVVWLQTCGKIS